MDQKVNENDTNLFTLVKNEIDKNDKNGKPSNIELIDKNGFVELKINDLTIPFTCNLMHMLDEVPENVQKIKDKDYLYILYLHMLKTKIDNEIREYFLKDKLFKEDLDIKDDKLQNISNLCTTCINLNFIPCDGYSIALARKIIDDIEMKHNNTELYNEDRELDGKQLSEMYTENLPTEFDVEKQVPEKEDLSNIQIDKNDLNHENNLTKKTKIDFDLEKIDKIQSFDVNAVDIKTDFDTKEDVSENEDMTHLQNLIEKAVMNLDSHSENPMETTFQTSNINTDETQLCKINPEIIKDEFDIKKNTTENDSSIAHDKSNNLKRTQIQNTQENPSTEMNDEFLTANEFFSELQTQDSTLLPDDEDKYEPVCKKCQYVKYEG